MNEQDKPWWASKTVWGGATAIISGIAGLFGYVLSADEQEAVTAAAVALASAIGGILAIYGRIKARAALK